MIDRRAFVGYVVLGVINGGCTMTETEMGEAIVAGENFWIDEGDGDQRYFSAPMNVVLADAG